jgi:hypothetical protein
MRKMGPTRVEQSVKDFDTLKKGDYTEAIVISVEKPWTG